MISLEAALQSGILWYPSVKQKVFISRKIYLFQKSGLPLQLRFSNLAMKNPKMMSSCFIFIYEQCLFTTTSSLMSRNACNGENGETGEKLPASGDLNWMPKVAPWRLAIFAKMAILAKIARGLAIIAINVPDPWRLAILAKMAIVAKLVILAKIARGLAISRMWQNIQIGCQKWPLQSRQLKRSL